MTKGIKAPAEERFWALVEKTDTCWLWIGTRDRRGYGRFAAVWRDGKVLAHRWAYETFVGPVPDGLELDHLCRTPACVNPAHLEPVTHAENVRRGAAAQPRPHCRQGHEWSDENTALYVEKSGVVRRSCRACTRAQLRNRRAVKRAERSDRTFVECRKGCGAPGLTALGRPMHEATCAGSPTCESADERTRP